MDIGDVFRSKLPGFNEHPNPPLQSAVVRATVCRALGLISQLEFDSLRLLFSVRNGAFAHWQGTASLDDADVRDQIETFISNARKISATSRHGTQKAVDGFGDLPCSSLRQRFIGGVGAIAFELMGTAFQLLRASNNRFAAFKAAMNEALQKQPDRSPE